MKRLLGVFALAGPALTGCSSVDQVPLVYISTAKVGLNVESGSPEVPGVSLMIGVDLTDAAYVPVAVARRCEGPALEMKICADKAMEILEVRGNSTDISENDRKTIARLADDVDKRRKELEAADNAFIDASSRFATASKGLAAAAAANETVKSLEAERKSAIADDPEATFDKEAQLEEARQAALKLADYKADTAKAESDREEAQGHIDAARDSLRSLMDQFRVIVPGRDSARLNQQDALSVFGTFKGDTGANTGSGVTGSVNLGKSFSTGIASQNLTRAIGRSTGMAAHAECVRAVTDAYKAMSDDEKTKNPLTAMLERCET